MIHDSGDLGVWADGLERRGQLVAPGQVHQNSAVLNPGLGKHNGDLPAIWGWRVVKINHADAPFFVSDMIASIWSLSMPNSVRISSVCSPRPGAPRRTDVGVFENTAA